MPDPIPIDDGLVSAGAQFRTGLGEFRLGVDRVGGRQRVRGQALSPGDIAPFAASSESAGIGQHDEDA